MKLIQEYEGKNIYCKLSSGRFYTGKVIEVAYHGIDKNGIEVFMFTIRDKYGAIVSFSNQEIKFIEEEKTLNGRKL